jgi:RNA polymerase sigma factor (sigma-70 family)
MEVSALKYSGGIGLHARSPLLRLQSDERLVALVRRGNATAFEALVSRYESRLLAFCRHLLGSREDAEDVLQEVFAAAFNAMTADDRPINVRPWLYRIARNRSLNHLRRIQAVGVDSMDVHLSDYGASTADRVHEREEFRLLVGDIHELPETQKTALVLREMDALSYDQIAEAMETTVPSVKSLLVRARISLAEASEARLLSCDEVRLELGEVAEGLRRRPSPLVRRHLRACKRCESFRSQLKETNKALAAIMPLGPLVILKKLAFGHLGHSAGSGATTAGSTAAAGSSAAAVAGTSAGGFVSAGVGAIATKAAAGLAAAAIVTAGAVEVDHSGHTRGHRSTGASASTGSSAGSSLVPNPPAPTTTSNASDHLTAALKKPAHKATTKPADHKPTLLASTNVKPANAATKTTATTTTTTATQTTTLPGRTQTQTDPTVLSAPQSSSSSTSSTTSTPAASAAPVIPPTQVPPPPPVPTTADSTPPPTTTTTTTTGGDPGDTGTTTTTTTPTTTTPTTTTTTPTDGSPTSP